MMTYEDFTLFCEGSQIPYPTPSSNINPVVITSAPPANDDVTNFKKSIKRDHQQYPQLSEPHFYIQWHQQIESLADIHDTHHVLDPDYVPSTTEEEVYFDLQQKFMWTVATRVFKTAKTALIRTKYIRTKDSQKVFAEVHLDAMQSLSAHHEAAALKKKLEELRVEKWQGAHEKFVIHWEQLMIKYQEYALNTEEGIPPETTRKMWLKDAVRANPVLAHCETNENLKFYSEKIAFMSYDTYFTVLKMTAMADDEVHK
jgi:hypothetical protein